MAELIVACPAVWLAVAWAVVILRTRRQRADRRQRKAIAEYVARVETERATGSG